MNNKEYLNFSPENYGCSARGTCSLPPAISALQELLIYIIKQSVHYVIELNRHNLNNEKLIIEIINSLSFLNYIYELNENQFFEIIQKNYYALNNSKNALQDYCKKNNSDYNFLEYSIDFDENSNLSKAIKTGEQLQKKSYYENSVQTRNYIQLLFIVIKNICSDILNLSNFNIHNKYLINIILKSVDILNDKSINTEKVKQHINLLALKNLAINLSIAKQVNKFFGNISEVSISHSSRIGKAILVSGYDLFTLKKILDLTADKNVDIYTHSGLIISHALEEFKRYNRLIGHYDNPLENCIVDFATFPGAILLTKNSQNNTEFLYRGKIFSNDYRTPQGTIKIENENFDLLVQTAIDAKGFTKGKTKPSTTLGYNETETFDFINKVMDELEGSLIKHLFIIIGNTIPETQKEYLRIFSQNIKEDEFIIALYPCNNSKNIKSINLGNYEPFIVDFLHKILKNKKYLSGKITYIFNSCNAKTITGIIYLKNQHLNDMYISQCSPRLLSPSVFETFTKEYDVKITSDPVSDLKYIRKNYQA